jgi:hypothetical protein
MNKPDWARAWELLEEHKQKLSQRDLALQKPVLDAIAALLNKQDVHGYTLLREWLVQNSIIKFYAKSFDRLYAYRDWIATKVEPKGEHFEDVDKAYRDAFDAKYNQVRIND